MKNIREMSARQAIRYAKRQARSCFLGMVTESEDQEIGGVLVSVNTIRKFNRRALLNLPKTKKSKPAGDCSIIREGEPGSPERLAAYVEFYSSNGCVDNKYNGNVTPFMEQEID